MTTKPFAPAEIINDILDFSKIEAGQFELEPINFNIYKAVEETTDMLVLRAQEQGIELLVRFMPDLPEYVIGDPGRIRQILLNLAGNAIKFTNDGYVLIKVGVKKKISNKCIRLYFEIEDTGIGIPKDKLDHIFDKFTQAEESTTRKFGGTGLGLSISSKLVQIMEGSIGVKSILGKGSVFSFDIKLLVGEKVEEKNTATIPVCDFTGVRTFVVDGSNPSKVRKPPLV